jgi:hypothetical protein
MAAHDQLKAVLSEELLRDVWPKLQLQNAANTLHTSTCSHNTKSIQQYT